MSTRKRLPASRTQVNVAPQLYQYAILPNGLRLVHRRTDGEIAHLALMIGAGARHEGALPEGIAHLSEHMLFKGTQKRSARQVVAFLENVGCDLNAYTSREETCIHASFLNMHYKRALELFADVAFNSVFPEVELEKEKQVVLDEINSYKDNPAEEIFDRFENELFAGHPLGHYILGRPESVNAINRRHLLTYASERFVPEKMVLVSVGDIDFNQLYHIAFQYFGSNGKHPFAVENPVFSQYHTFHLTIPVESHLSHCIIGMPAYHYNHPDKMALVLLNNILGGPSMQARLNQNIREKYGIAYSIESQLANYSDAGWLAIYMGTDAAQTQRAITLALKELKKLRERALGTMQLARAKQQLIVQLAISRESRLSEALSVGKAWLMKNSALTVAQIVSMIESIDAQKLLEVANEVFDENRMSFLHYHGD